MHSMNVTIWVVIHWLIKDFYFKNKKKEYNNLFYLNLLAFK